ncbi:gamma-butyrobetaine dioxygenase, partial [Marinomonas sp. 42_23_T18]
MNSLDTTIEIASFTPYPIKQHPVQVHLNQESLTLVWDNGHQSEYHYLWLRDNCHCPKCISTLTREQIFEICDVPLTIKPLTAYISDNHRLMIEWDYAEHCSQYHPGWLLSHCYSESVLEEKKWSPHIWDKERISRELPTKTFDSVMQSDLHLLAWLRDLRDYGIALVTQVDTQENTLIKVANRISFIRETNFGTIFNVQAKADANT